MNPVPCCGAAGGDDAGIDLGHADGIEATLRRCVACGREWIDLHCEASGSGGTVPVDAAEAARLRSLPAGPERKEALRTWLRERP